MKKIEPIRNEDPFEMGAWLVPTINSIVEAVNALQEAVQDLKKYGHEDSFMHLNGLCECFNPMSKKSRSFFDMSDKEKKDVVSKAAQESNRAQKDLVESTPTQETEEWREQFNKKFRDTDWYPNEWYSVESFIQSLLTQREEFAEKVGYKRGLEDARRK